MDNKINILLDKINMDKDSYPYFNDAIMKKIVVNSKRDLWTIFIDKDELLPINILKELDDKKKLLDSNNSDIRFVFNIKI